MKPPDSLLNMWCVFAFVLAGCTQPAGDAGQGSAIDQGVPGPPAAVVLVVVDTLRADITSMTGHYRNTTPQLDKLAAQGVVFTAAYSPSCWTVPSMASLHTSLYPASHGIVNGAIADDPDRGVVRQQVLGDSFVTLAEVLQSAGYKTVGVASNRHLAAELGFGQGFDVYYDEAHFGEARWLNQVAKAHLVRGFGRNWSSDFGNERSFLWLHYFDPHIPYMPRLPWIRAFADDYIEFPGRYAANRSRFELAARYPKPDASYRECALPLYEAEVAYWDDRFKRLADMLKVDSRDVLLVFTSDHGEQFGEHGGLGHRDGLYEEMVNVPLMFYWPRGIPGGRTIDSPVSIMDIYPTLLELAGLEIPAGTQGRSLAPLLRGKEIAPDPERELLYDLHPPRRSMRAIRSGKWKLFREPGDPVAVKLFDLEQDPGERDNLSQARPEVVQRLLARLDAAFDELPPAPEVEQVDMIDPELLDQLEHLGYFEGTRKADGGLLEP